MGEEFSIEDALIILRRRILYFLIPVMVIAPIGVLAVMLLPAKYTAQGRILIESQQIPQSYIQSTISSYAQERIQTIRQRVTTRELLLEIADDFDLFPRSMGLSESERVAIMRGGLNVRVITANRGRGQNAAIAFTVSYTDPDPGKAYLVANRFMTVFLDEDVKTRTAGASNTTEFFSREADRLRNAVAAIEDRISKYKLENADALPNLLNMHLDMLERAQSDHTATLANIEQLEEEKRFLESQLISGSSTSNNLAAQITRLETELAILRATYHDNYPEIISKRQELAAIKRQMTPSREIERLRQALIAAEDRLTAAERAATPDPEAIAQAEVNVSAAREALSNRISDETRRDSTSAASGQIEGRITLIENRIRTLNKQAEDLLVDIADYEQRIAKTPEVERGLLTLTRDQGNTFREYQELLAKQQDAQLAENLEENRQAEKFSILEPARRPDKPSSPDRPKLIVMALFASLAAGAVTAFLAELAFSTIRGRTHISHLIEGHPIAVIPYISSDEDRRSFLPFLNRRNRRSDLAAETA